MNCGVQCYLLLLPRGLLLTSVICLEWRELELVWRRQCVLARAATQTLTPGPGSRSITKLYFNESWGCWEPETILLFRRQANTRPSIDLFSNQLFYLSLYCAVKTNIIWISIMRCSAWWSLGLYTSSIVLEVCWSSIKAKYCNFKWRLEEVNPEINSPHPKYFIYTKRFLKVILSN